jgi:prepilin-type N-terminal cleavage/methylation domain-containing protein
MRVRANTARSVEVAACPGVSAAFTLMEVMVAVAIIGVTFIALYAGLAHGFSTVQLARENLRATQILTEKMETIRLYNWDQITDNKFIPDKFETTYYPAGGTNGTGVVYKGKLKIEDSKLKTNYEDDMKVVTIELEWTTGHLKRSRTLSTQVARYGLYNYIY